MKWRVSLQHTTAECQTIVIEADTEEQARAAALECAEYGDIDWRDDENFCGETYVTNCEVRTI